MAKRDIQSQINTLLETWDMEQQEKFIRDVVPLLELYHDIGKDFELLDKEAIADAATVRLVRSAYILSKLADRYAAKFVTIRIECPDLWRKMESINQ